MDATWYKKQVEYRIKSVSKKVLAQAVAQGEVAVEMAEARRVQASFLPAELPNIRGYDLSVRLEAARETSGDFYDFISLPGNRQAILVADVADKGAAAALFMTSTRTLLRTYAEEYPTQPERVIEEVNRRLLQDTRSGLFVTVFFGVLDSQNNRLTYVNAGHNPPLIITKGKDNSVQKLDRTGMPVGILEDQQWESETLNFEPGDALVVYTDGLTEALAENGEYYGEARLNQNVLQALRTSQDLLSSEMIIEQLLSDRHNFLGVKPPSDDTTLLVIIRQDNPSS